ncbi:MAG: ribose 5-phosphate isomerase B [Planctomycetota bacterium]|jgi:ribose 5-phosphate isomerase B
MNIAIGSDHRGCQLAQRLAESLQAMGHTTTILSDLTCESSDYPDAACKVGNAVRLAQVDRGVLICGSGIGMSIAANKVPGVRAALVHDELGARMSRAHNDANVLCLSADLIGPKIPAELISTWIETEFEGGRHARRVEKIARIESRDHICESDTQCRCSG